jgi:uncharacterized membrane protein
MIVVVDDLPLISPTNPYRSYHMLVRAALTPHAVFGIFALISGPLQFSTRLRQMYPRIHRRLGKAYIASILISAPMGALIPVIGPKDLFFTIGVGIHSLCWFVTGIMAFLTAKNGNMADHRKWAIRSYVVTFSFVLTRTVILPIASHVTIHQFGLVDVINNFFYIFATDVVLCWREITTASVIRPAIVRDARSSDPETPNGVALNGAAM